MSRDNFSSNPFGQLLTTRQASEIFDLSEHWVRMLSLKGEIVSYKQANRLFHDMSSIARYKQTKGRK